MGTNYIVVASHVAYRTARDALLESLQQCGWPADKIVVLLSGSADSGTLQAIDGQVRRMPSAVPEADAENEVGYGVRRVFRTAANIYEYAAYFLPLAMGGQEEDAFLLLHDTCKALHPGFGPKVAAAFEDFRREPATDILWCCPTGQCNLCIFNVKASEVAWRKWGAWMSLDKMQAVFMEHRKCNTDSIKSCTKELVQEFAAPVQLVTGVIGVYSAGIQRTRLHFPYIDVDKYYFNIHCSQEHPQIP
jgi:hypothetical protein